MKIFAGADHAGVGLKDTLVAHLQEQGHQVEDLGTKGPESVDYPDFGAKVAHAVAANPGALGLLCCGTGIGMAMAANRIPGVRAAVLSDTFSARATRQHNDANVLCLGERVVGQGVAISLADAFFSASFEGGRHQRRVDKITALEQSG